MEKDQLSRKLAVILHADVVGSTSLVQKNETLAHQRIRNSFKSLSEIIESYHGIPHEIRGDALVAEFPRASDAVTAALQFQHQNAETNTRLDDDIRPEVRIGISLGEVVIADGTLTGEGVVLAQRLEQLAEPNGVVVQGNVSETVPARLPFQFENLGEQELKGFDRPVRAFSAITKPGETIPGPTAHGSSVNSGPPASGWKSRRVQIAIVLILAISVGLAFLLQPGQSPDALALPTGPRIAVMPFTSLGDDADQHFGRQITNDISSALSKFDLFVFSHLSTRQLEQMSCQQIAEAIGANRILEGTVQRSSDRLRVTAQFVDTRDCRQLWSETYDRELTTNDIFDVQDDITSRVAANIGSLPDFFQSGKSAKQVRGKGPENLDVYDCGLLMQQWLVDFAEEPQRQGTRCFERAVELEPDYWGAHAGLGWAYINAYKYNYAHLPDDGMERAHYHLKKAIELNPRSQKGYYGLAMHRLYTECDWESFRSAAEEAIAINPNDASVLFDLGAYIWSSGAYERGLELVKKSVELTPRHPPIYRWVFFSEHFRNREFREALAEMQKMDLKNNHIAQINLASIYGHLGETQNAQETIDHILDIYPSFADDPRKPFVIRCHPEERIEFTMEGLRKAGFDVPPARSE